MPFGERPELATASGGHCAHCGAPTQRACLACAHLVCHACEQRHDRELRHRVYGEV